LRVIREESETNDRQTNKTDILITILCIRPGIEANKGSIKEEDEE